MVSAYILSEMFASLQDLLVRAESRVGFGSLPQVEYLPNMRNKVFLLSILCTLFFA